MDFLDLLFIVLYFGIILWIARWAHNPKVAGSSPVPATNRIAIYLIFK